RSSSWARSIGGVKSLPRSSSGAIPWLISLVWALLGFKTDGSKGFKVWPVGLSLVVAPFLFGALGAAINPKKEIKEAGQASATPIVEATAVGTPTAAPAQEESAAGTAAASMTPTAPPAEQPAATRGPEATTKPTATPKAVTAPSPTPKSGPLHRIND